MSHEALAFHFVLPQQPQVPAGGPTTTQTGGAPAGSAPTTSGTQAPGGAAPGAQPEMCGGQTMMMMGVFLVLMWLLVLGPERKRRKQTEQMMSSLKSGDRVVTVGGMHGVVVQVADKTVTLRFDQQKVVFDRTAIARVERDEPAKDEAKKA
jgi:preprotein translocase subunit YajC